MPDDVIGPVAPIGHNRPPPETETLGDIRERLEGSDQQLFERLAELERGAAKIPQITSEDVARQVVTWIAQCRLALTDLAKVHARVKAPYLAVVKFIDARYLRPRDRLNKVVVGVQRQLDEYRRDAERRQRAAEAEAREKAEKAARIAAERAATLQAEADRAEAEGRRRRAVELDRAANAAQAEAEHQEALASMPDQPVRIHGEYGATAFVVRKWQINLVDPELLPAQFWQPDFAAIDAALQAALKATGKPPEIPGVEFENQDETRVRRC